MVCTINKTLKLTVYCQLIWLQGFQKHLFVMVSREKLWAMKLLLALQWDSVDIK